MIHILKTQKTTKRNFVAMKTCATLFVTGTKRICACYISSLKENILTAKPANKSNPICTTSMHLLFHAGATQPKGLLTLCSFHGTLQTLRHLNV
jgi:hypothetical protein